MNLSINNIKHKGEKQTCSRYESCNAVVCPLDKDWRTHVFLRDEKVCIYQRELVKKKGLERVISNLGESLALEIVRTTTDMCATNTHFLSRLNRSSDARERVQIS